MKQPWSMRKIALTAFLAFAAGSAGLWYMHASGQISASSVPVDIEKTFASSSVDSIIFDADVINVAVKRGDSSEVIVRLSGDIPKSDEPYVKVEAGVSGGVLKVDMQTTKKNNMGFDVERMFYWMGNGFKSKAVAEIELPEKLYRSLDVAVDTGNLTVDSIQADTLKLETDTGNITLEGFQGELLDAKSDTGNIRMKDAQGEITAKTDTGEIDLSVNAPSHPIQLQSDTGSIAVIASSVKALGFQLSTDTGRTTVSAGDSTIEYDLKERRRSIGSFGQGGPLLKAQADTGNVTLEMKK